MSGEGVDAGTAERVADVLQDIKALWDREGFGTEEAISEPLYARLQEAIRVLTPPEAVDEYEAACGHVLSPERDDLPPCDLCDRCENCCGCTCDDCGEDLHGLDLCRMCDEREPFAGRESR